MTILQKLGVAACTALLSLLPAVAQTNGSNSPYSRYGLGLLGDGGQGFNKGMAGLALGLQDGKELNVANPASYASIDSLSFLFDVGLTLQTGQFKTGGVSRTAKNTAVDYVTAGFRLSPRLGMSVGLLPFSTVGYRMTSTSTMNVGGSDVTQTEAYSGDGGLHEVYAGVGWKPFDNFSIGLNAGYLWGELNHTVTASFSSSDINSRRRQYYAELRTYKLDLGVQYAARLDRRNGLVVGAVYGLGHDVDRNAHYYDQRIGSSSVESADTLTAQNAFALPHTLGVGVVWNYRERLRVGMDYQWQMWKNVKSPGLVDLPGGGVDYAARTGQFSDRHKWVLGAEYIPNRNSLHWRHHVRYRIGASYTIPYIRVDGADGPKSYAATVGVGLPIVNYWSNRCILNLSAGYERVKPALAGHVTENYFRFTIGLSFNERWFAKWKVQ